jgi:hypothetical protein
MWKEYGWKWLWSNIIYYFEIHVEKWGERWKWDVNSEPPESNQKCHPFDREGHGLPSKWCGLVPLQLWDFSGDPPVMIRPFQPETSFSFPGWLTLLLRRYIVAAGSIKLGEIVPLKHIRTVTGSPLQTHIGNQCSPERRKISCAATGRRGGSAVSWISAC